jgi:aminocarboxymuconate-semialdehyde decarboxylase
MIIDIYTHFFPEAYHARWQDAAPNLSDIGKRMRSVRGIYDLDHRFKEMDLVDDDYRHIISLPGPPLEAITEPETGTELSRVANDAMAELSQRHQDRFPAFVAALAMHDFDNAMTEAGRAIDQLGAAGIQIFTNVRGRPLDEPEFEPLFALMAEKDLPIWLHPARPAMVPDYAAEQRSRYEMWWALGWPYDTSVAMSRLVLTGLFDRYPGIKIITHHCGGMIPYFEGRLDKGMEALGGRTSDEDYSGVLSALKKPHGDYFKMFYADTAMFGADLGTRCGIEYFGLDKVVFASDSPFAGIADAIAMIDRLDLDDDARDKLCRGNAERLINRSFV